MKSNRKIVRVRKLRDEEPLDLLDKTPAERIEMVWQITMDAWAFKGEPIDQSRLQRHIVRVHRRES
jgi:hypothetical protein